MILLRGVLMLNEIIKGISTALHRAFGFEIFVNQIEQGLQTPCFFIAVLKSEVTPLLGRRCLKRNSFDIQYFPTESRKHDEMYQVAEQLIEHLEFIALPNGDLLHAANISYEVIDGVLHFFVTYSLPSLKTAEQIYMEALETEVNTTNMNER